MRIPHSAALVCLCEDLKNLKLFKGFRGIGSTRGIKGLKPLRWALSGVVSWGMGVSAGRLPALLGVVVCSGFFALSSVPAWAAGGLWTSDFEAAKKQAAAEKKDLLLDFTGSDWCGWCIQLQKEVFSQKGFQKGAPGRFVLVELDFPQTRELPAAVKAQNERLQKEYGVEGFPTIYLADASGRPYARTGYKEGGDVAYLKHLEELAAAREARDLNWKQAEGVQGVDRARLLAAGLKVLDEEIVAQYYKPVVDEIRALDPKDETGVGAAFAFKSQLGAFGEGLEKLAEKGDSSLYLPEAEKFLAGHPGAGPRQKQKVYLELLRYYRPPNDNETVLGLMRKVEALDPSSDEGQGAAKIAKRVEEMIAKGAGQKK